METNLINIFRFNVSDFTGREPILIAHPENGADVKVVETEPEAGMPAKQTKCKVTQ